jgi:membrane-bound lytic murein transglycosylase D
MKILKLLPICLCLIFVFNLPKVQAQSDLPPQDSNQVSKEENLEENQNDSSLSQQDDVNEISDDYSVFSHPQKKDLPRIQKKSEAKNTLLLLHKNAGEDFLDAVPIATQEAKTNKKTQKVLLETNKTYQKMLKAYQNGDMKQSGKYFSQFIKQLNGSGVDAKLLFYFFDDFEEILAKLNNLYGIENSIENDDKYSQNTIPLELGDEALVEKYIKIFSQGKAKERIKAALERSGTFKDIVEPALREFDLPPELKYLPVIESLYQTGDVSRAGAAGIWQIMPSRGRALGLKVNYWIDERFDPQKATYAAALYLKQLYLMLNDWHLVLAAYNRGEYGLVRDMKFSNASNISEMVKRNAIPRETQNYVPQFIAVVRIANNPSKYGFGNIHYKESLEYDTVKTDKVIDLKIAAEAAGTTVEEIKKLNPALKAWSTPQGYPGFELKIPYGSKNKFLENIAKVEDLNPSPGFIKYKVVKGDYLGKIAAMFRTSEKNIAADNPALTKSKYLQPGMILVIRPGKEYLK